MASTKIPTVASARRAITTLKKFGAVDNIDLDADVTQAHILLKVDKTILSPKKTIRKKPKHKMVKITAHSCDKEVNCPYDENLERRH